MGGVGVPPGIRGGGQPIRPLSEAEVQALKAQQQKKLITSSSSSSSLKRGKPFILISPGLLKIHHPLQ